MSLINSTTAKIIYTSVECEIFCMLSYTEINIKIFVLLTQFFSCIVLFCLQFLYIFYFFFVNFIWILMYTYVHIHIRSMKNCLINPTYIEIYTIFYLFHFYEALNVQTLRLFDWIFKFCRNFFLSVLPLCVFIEGGEAMKMRWKIEVKFEKFKTSLCHKPYPSMILQYLQEIFGDKL